ncbi:OmpA family protein [Halomicronema sp. CCY15110]|uniref:OmpA family protein n=1 Tax=Halomicronema sp. CCY15110 TaxID=2767773 RepID=UPI00194EBC4D|nr:OmpA family protein [Halomicronema sp. CCY15110]
MNTLWTVLALGTGLSLGMTGAIAQAPSGYDITVNSAIDGVVTPDDDLTLREAILLVNGALALEALSPAEQALVTPAVTSTIGFDLPSDDTAIALTAALPPLQAVGLVLDGTTQPGYGATRPYLPNVPVPVVSLTPAAGTEILTGLTITGSDVTVRGLNLYGFAASPRIATLTTPSADILVINRALPADLDPDAPMFEGLELADPEATITGVTIEQNWLGTPPDESMPEQRSAAGVVVHNATDVRIADNLIQHHEASGVITGFRADGLELDGNAIIGNGLAGMPDGVRLEGSLIGAAVTNNLICANDGSGIYLFKPEGAVQIESNAIRFNGRRFRRAAVYVMGHGHTIVGNEIGYQPGPGVAVSAYPLSDRNLIRENQFAQLDGLSIDLLAQGSSDILHFQRGDGPNPPRNHHHRRAETGNGAINAPEFNVYAFRTGPDYAIVGQADPGSEVDLYQIKQDAGFYSPLTEPLMTTTADGDGNFSFDWDTDAGAWVSAIASDPEFGTSEPAPVIGLPASNGTLPARPPTTVPFEATCYPPVAAIPDRPAEPIVLRVPRNIHFALDQSFISLESSFILDQIADAMQTYPSLTVELQGHTDPRASVGYNQALSERRALAARDYLLSQGIAAERLRIVPFGESRRRTQGNTTLDYARDRRVEFIFTDTQGLDIIFEAVESDLQIE